MNGQNNMDPKPRETQWQRERRLGASYDSSVQGDLSSLWVGGLAAVVILAVLFWLQR